MFVVRIHVIGFLQDSRGVEQTRNHNNGNDDKQEAPKPEPKKEDTSIVDKLKFWDSGNKDKAPPELQYRIQVKQNEDGTLVTVTDKNEKRDISPTANRILSMLYDQLK